MTMTKQDRICMISLFAVMLVLMGVPALCLSTNTAVDEMGTLANAACSPEETGEPEFSVMVDFIIDMEWHLCGVFHFFC